MTDEIVTAWVNGYIGAWESNDPAQIGALFTDDSSYLTAPFRTPWVGRDVIVAGWLSRQDTPGNQHFTFDVLGISDDLAFVQGLTRYLSPPAEYANLWVIRLDDQGRCSEFTEWFMAVPTR
jgi:SnoaL-like domain